MVSYLILRTRHHMHGLPFAITLGASPAGDPDLPDRLQAETLLALAAASDRLREPDACGHHLERCEAAVRQFGGEEAFLVVTGLNLPLARGSLALLRGRLADAISHHREAVLLCERAGLDRERAFAAASLGRAHYYQGNHEEAGTWFQMARTIAGRVGECWPALFLCALFGSQLRLLAARDLADGGPPGVEQAQAIEQLRNQAIAEAEEARKLSREYFQSPREMFRSDRNLAEVLGCACDRHTREAADEADRRFQRAMTLLAASRSQLLTLEEPFAEALWHLTAATVHGHHGNVQEASGHYRDSLEGLRRYAAGHRLLQLQLSYGLFLRRSPLLEDRHKGLVRRVAA